MRKDSVDWRLAQAAQVACILEADAPKVGNVNRLHDFEDTTLEDFHLSALAIGPVIGRVNAEGVGVTVLAGVQATQAQVGRNTNLGILLLLAPLAAAWPGFTGRDTRAAWRANCRKLLNALTVADCAAVYQAIQLANPGGLGQAAAQDVRTTPEPQISLLEAMCLSAERDLIGAQYRDNFALVFEQALPALDRALAQGLRLPQAIAQAHLQLLSHTPDTLIARKLGLEAALTVQQQAQEVWQLGGWRTQAGRAALRQFDAELRREGNRRNPGSTADLIAATIFVHLLSNPQEEA